MKLFTIGHSNHALTKFVSLLADNHIRRIVDVRTSPYSRFNPQFNREDLQAALLAQQLDYVFAGEQLGGRPADPACYKTRTLPGDEADFLHEVDYPEVMKQSWFLQGIERLLELAQDDTTAILCSEENPAECHRHHLIAKHLMAQHPDDVEVQHIRGDGTVFPARTLLSSVDQTPSEQLALF